MLCTLVFTHVIALVITTLFAGFCRCSRWCCMFDFRLYHTTLCAPGCPQPAPHTPMSQLRLLWSEENKLPAKEHLDGQWSWVVNQSCSSENQSYFIMQFICMCFDNYSVVRKTILQVEHYIHDLISLVQFHLKYNQFITIFRTFKKCVLKL